MARVQGGRELPSRRPRGIHLGFKGVMGHPPAPRKLNQITPGTPVRPARAASSCCSSESWVRDAERPSRPRAGGEEFAIRKQWEHLGCAEEP